MCNCFGSFFCSSGIVITPFQSLSLATMAEDESLSPFGTETMGRIEGILGAPLATPAGSMSAETLASPAGSMSAKKEDDSLSASKCHLLKVPQEQLLSDMRKTLRSGISKYIRDKIPTSKKNNMPSTSMRSSRRLTTIIISSAK